MEKEQLIKFEQVEKTPFQIVKAERKWYITIGGKRACEQTFKIKQEAITFVKEKPWELIASIVAIIIERYEDNKKIKSQNDNQKTE